MTKQDKYIKKLEKEIMQFSDKTIAETISYLVSCMRACYSAGAYHSIKELTDKQNEIK
jgi:hypothetical protein